MSEWVKGYYTGITVMTVIVLYFYAPKLLARPFETVAKHLNDRQRDRDLYPFSASSDMSHSVGN